MFVVIKMHAGAQDVGEMKAPLKTSPMLSMYGQSTVFNYLPSVELDAHRLPSCGESMFWKSIQLTRTGTLQLASDIRVQRKNLWYNTS